jgi:hypothetical protein
MEIILSDRYWRRHIKEFAIMKEYDIDVQYNTLQEKNRNNWVAVSCLTSIYISINRERWSLHGRETSHKFQESVFHKPPS